MSAGNNIFQVSDRKVLQSMALDIYECDYRTHVQALLVYRYQYNLAVNRLYPYCNPTRNPLRRIAQAQSVLYARPPRLYSTPDTAARAIRKYVPNLYPTLEEVQTLTCALADVFVWPYWDDIDEVVKLQIVPPHLVDVKMDDNNPLTVAALRVQTEPRSRLNNTGKYRVWTRDTWWDSTSDADDWDKIKRGDIVNANPLGVIPVVWFKLRPVMSARVWGIWSNQDLINGTLEIGEMETLHNKVNYLRSFRQASINADQLEPGNRPKDNEVQVAPDTVLPYKIESTALADEADQFIETINALEISLAASRGISAKSYYRQAVGEGELDNESNELKRHWSKQIKVFNEQEKALYRLIALLINKNTAETISTDTVYRVDYIEPVEIADPNEALTALKSGIELNITSIEDYIYKTQPEYETIEEVRSKIEEIMDSRIKVMTYLREHNMPSDPTQLGSDPEQNGANGPKLVQNAFDNNSIEYNNKPNDARGVRPS